MDASFRRALDEMAMGDTSRYLSAARDMPVPSALSVNSKSSGLLVPATSAHAEVDTEQHPSGIIPVLQVDTALHPKERSGSEGLLSNVVATCSLGCALDLKRIAQHARNAEYNPKRFAAVIMRIREPKTTALIFSSGLVKPLLSSRSLEDSCRQDGVHRCQK